MRMLKAFPKAFVVVAVFVGSTLLFSLWWWFGGGKTQEAEAKPLEMPQAAETSRVDQDRQARVPKIPRLIESLVVMNGDLFNAATGEVVIEDWLKGEAPVKLVYDAPQQKFIGKFAKGLMVYHLDGSEAGTIATSNGVLVPDEMNYAIYAEGGDIWKADIDWQKIELGEARQVTSVGSIEERFFIKNVLLGTHKNLILRNRNQFLRVNLETGEVATTPMSMLGLERRRSPSGDLLLGALSEVGGTRFFAYHVDEDRQEFFELGSRMAVTDFLWVSEDRCSFLVANQQVGLYQREPEGISEVVMLPFPCAGLVGPSPDGKHVLAAGKPGLLMIDIDGKESHLIELPLGNAEWMGSGVLLAACDVVDTKFRGTWRIEAGKEPVRITNEPYLYSRDGTASVAAIRDSGLTLFATKSGVFQLKLGETEASLLTSTGGSAVQFLVPSKLSRN